MSADSSPTILVVDDDSALAVTLAAIISRNGYNAVAAYSAVEALHKLETLRPALLITDVMMPGVNGIELALEVRRVHPEIKIFLISGNTGSLEIMEAQATGVNFQLASKPIAPSDLMALISDALSNLAEFPRTIAS